MANVSIMESDEIRAALDEADRAEAAPWVDYPPTPAWYPVGSGFWAAALVLVIGELDGPVFAFCMAGLIAIELGFLAWYRRYRGAMPTGAAPREFRAAIVRFATASCVAAGTVLVLSLAVSPWLGAPLALVAFTGIFAWYERAYADAARRTRERLG